MNVQDFARRENWYGACYELAIDYSAETSDDRLLTAMRAFWSSPALRGPVEGPYAARERLMSPLPAPFVLPESIASNQYGIVTLPIGLEVGCKLRIVREGFSYLCIPMGMIDLAYHASYPLAAEPNRHWMVEVNHLLIQIAQDVYLTSPFDLAVVGEDVGSVYPAADMIVVDQVIHGGCLLSPSLFNRLQPQVAFDALQSGLRWREWHD